MLTERQKRILWAIINDYIVSAEPVGSRTVSKKEGVGFSAATVRNEMADLEEMGFLEQPHTSAGRIPSQKGYRFYVDHLLTPRLWRREDLIILHESYTLQMDRIEEVIQQTTSLLSNLTNYMTIILGPKISENRLKHLQIVPLFDRSAISILVTDTGYVYQKRIMIPEKVPYHEAERLVHLLNYRLNGIPLPHLRKAVAQELKTELAHQFSKYGELSGLINQVLQAEKQERVYTSGATRMLDQPEFQDVEKVKMLLDLIEENQTMVELMEPTTNGVQVRIGNEIHHNAVTNCSIISASYMINGEPVGTIGVLGPTRMDYGRVIGLIDLLSKDFSRRLSTLFELD
ncbi:heat-inducible transcriptional repressor HrcA [Hazenella coriacea]|uniref:Heat-inducible transcription repressor HrcA n=1 Tax=Hazenella coriacea TaxID=1179467 RepID=A0A4V6NZ91_9BACL|nr:heat-inducible transcriptional repressor HrcA [Hazenella coriacea]TCS94777.1 heat-inducible transcription repressor HrcA [Hazenella coriacea]